MRWFASLMCLTCVITAGCSSGDDAESSRTPTAALLSQPVSSQPASSTLVSSQPASSETTPALGTPASTAAVIDSCLVGRWRQVSGHETITLDGTRVVTTGWQGRELDFRPQGVEIVTFDRAAPITAPKAPRGAYRVIYKGRAVYKVSTRNGVLRFVTVDFSRTRVSWRYGTRSDNYTPGNTPPGAVEYTCGATTHTQRNDFYQATFTRLP